MEGDKVEGDKVDVEGEKMKKNKIKKEKKRNRQERIVQCLTLTRKLEGLGFNLESSGLLEFKKLRNEFINDEKECDTVIKFDEYPNVKLLVCLRLSKNVDCSVTVKHR